MLKSWWVDEGRMERMDGGSEDGATGYLIDAPKDAALEGRKIAMRGNT